MQTNLRPMTLGEILDRTAQIYRTNFVLFAGIAAVFAGTMLVLNLMEIGLSELLRRLHMTQHLPWVTLSFLVIIFPLMVILAGAAVAANNRAVAWINLDQPATIRAAYGSILPRLGRYIWLTTMAFFIIYTPFVVLSIAYFVFLLLYGQHHGLFKPGGVNSDPQSAVIVLIATLGFSLLALAAFAYAVVMALRYSLSVPAAVVEDLKARKALRRSVELTKGSRGRIFVLGLLIAVIQLGLVTITQIFFIVAAVRHHGVLPVWVQIAQQIVGFCTNSFIGPMYATGLTLFYYDQRIRKEGYDIEWMMEAAGMSGQALPAEATLPAAPAASATEPDSAVPAWEPLPPEEPHG